MKLHEQGQLLRIFVGESDKYQGKPLYQAIVRKAKELELAGATVTRGISGFGPRSKMHTTKFLRLSVDAPLIIEIVDSEEYIQKILPFLDEAVTDGLITLEKVQVIKYKSRQSS
ncbi:MAG: hypothetical protein CSA11_03060 [Chloroflexi bacterium]|nr:MAG: hypothetical protein CSB13_07765 [Chloroflexota bacterium]PIE81864.1 MAG: hypothetical protein CSA11_03060 [Chloroflexota bacterium]